MIDNMERQPKKILIIDDDPTVAESTQLALQARGYDALVANDGAKGLALAERERPDLIILDMMIPKRSGFLVLETLRQYDDSFTRVIMLTAIEGDRHREYADRLGVDGYLRKPFAIEELLKTIEKALNS